MAFAGQIFFDFAGYSTCAIGAALCLGFHLRDNFRFPYAAIGFSDFWRRWHISLSTFLRDYLYIPLGGNRAGAGARDDQSRHRHVHRRALARRGLDVCRLGFAPRRLSGDRTAPHALFGEAAWTETLRVKILIGLTTYVAVLVAWVFFRAADFETAEPSDQRDVRTVIRLAMRSSARAKFCRWRSSPFGILIAHWTLRDTSLETAVARLPRWRRGACLVPHALRHHPHSRKRQCIHLLPILICAVIPDLPWRGITVARGRARPRRRGCLGNLLPLARLRADAERHRRSLGRRRAAGETRNRS